MPQIPAEARRTPVTAEDAALLARISDHTDHAAWRWFADRFGRVAYRVARRLGLQDCDAQDATQAVLVAAGRAALRRPFDADLVYGWVCRAARSKAYNVLEARARAAGVTAGGDTSPATFHALLDTLASPEAEPALDAAEELTAMRWRLGRVMADCQEQFHPTVWASFWGTAVEGRTAAEIAAELGTTANAVWVSRNRVAARLREFLSPQN